MMNRLSMRTRIITVLYILSFTISLFIFYFLMNRVSVDVECTSYSEYTVNGADIYFAQDAARKGIIFKMDTRGRVSAMFDVRSAGGRLTRGLSSYDGNIYAVLENYIEQDDPSGNGMVSTPVYRVVCLDNKLRLISRSAMFSINTGEKVTAVSAEDAGIYITTISEDALAAKVYVTDYSILKDPDQPAEENLRLDVQRAKTATGSRFFSDAAYRLGELHVRTDSDMATGVFEVDPVIRNAVSSIRLSIGQLLSLYSVYIIIYLACLIIWFIVLYLLIRTVTDRNRSFYYLFIAEALVFVITLAGVIAVCSAYYSAREREHTRFAILSMIGLEDEINLGNDIDYTDSSFYDSSRYRQLKRGIVDFIKREGNADIFYDVFVYNLKDEYVCVSAGGKNRQPLSEIYGQDMSSIADRIYRGGKYAAVDFKFAGQNYRAVAATFDDLNPRFAIVGIINSTTDHKSVFVDNRAVFILFLCAFAIASALVVLAWFLHLRDITALEEALDDTALGKSMPERPLTLGSDIKDMWDAVAQIHRKVDNIEYTKMMILEAYYRFAPKNVEKVLSRKSIIEVGNKDAIDVSGTIGTFGIDLKEHKRTTRLDSIIDSVGEYQKEHNAIIIGKAPDISRLQLFFMEDEKETVSSFVELLEEAVDNTGTTTVSTVLYYDKCRFAVIGNKDEATTYLRSSNRDLITRISVFATKHKLDLVITEDIKERENITSPLRFIGYAGEDSSGNMVKLYEVLDACRGAVRKQRLSTLDKFNEALRLFYEKDFYIARTRFSEILKDAPDDLLVKFYVFESDRYLNESAEGDSHKILDL
ncbi:MAG: hypothetical protein E7307_07995 [Butyrivibrio sp.]|nr:hypothetical protein [Butyrivibrio sp.]